MSRSDVLLPGLSLALFALYLYSAYPALSPYRDSGDMACAAWTLGVAHPPGYPLYLLLAKAWLWLFPFGNVAFRLHVFSALAGALAVLTMGRFLIKGPQPALGSGGAGAGTGAGAYDDAPCFSAIAAMLLLGLAPSFWHLALVSEMYTLNALVGAGLLLLTLPSSSAAISPERDRRQRLLLSALLFGLGLGNHQTLVAAAPGLLLAFRRPPSEQPEEPSRGGFLRLLPLAAAFALLGLILYAYLPLRSMTEPALDWGEPRGLRGFLRMLTRADYGGVRLHPERAAGFSDLGDSLASAAFAARLFLAELGWPGAALGLWGAWTARKRPQVQGCLAAFLASGPLFLVWANLSPEAPETYAILEPHLILPLVFAAALAGYGFADLCLRLREARASKKVFRFAPVLLLFLLAFAWAATQHPAVLSRLRTRSDFTAWDYGKGLAASLPPGALILDPDDTTAFALSYLGSAHGLRPDIVPLLYFRTRWGYEQLKRRHPELLPPEDIRSGRELLWTLVEKSLRDERPLYVDLPQKAPDGTEPVPAGLAYRLFKGTAGLDDRLRLAHLSERLNGLMFRRPAPEGSGFFSRHAIDYWASALNNLGIQAMNLRWTEVAAALYRRALSLDPGLSEAWNNLANALLASKDLAGAEGCYRLSMRDKPAPQVMYNLGRVYLLGGRLSEAEEAFVKSIAAGGPPDARNDLGLVHLRTGRARQAVEGWRSLLRDFPGYGLAYYNLALGYEQLGEKENAEAALRLYLELVRDPAERRAAANWLDRLKKS